MKTNQSINPILHGALWGVGVLAVVGVGIVWFNSLVPSNAPTHGVSETTEIEETIDQEKIAMQENIATLQQHVEDLQSDTTQAEAILQLKKEISTLEEQVKLSEENIMNVIPLGSMIATNGNTSKAEMNERGWALCDGSSILSQVSDAILKGNTLNLAGRTLIGEGNYAKDSTISFQLGHVDEYKIGDTVYAGEVQHRLVFAEMPYHTHNINLKASQGGNESIITTPADRYSISSQNINIETLPAGGDQPHNNMSPFHVVQYYIKVK